MNNKQKDAVKVFQLKEVVTSSQMDVDDLCTNLEITIEDLLERFEDRLIENYEKFIPSGWTDEQLEHVYNDEIEEEEFGS